MKRHYHNRKIKGVWTRKDYLIFAVVLIGIGSILSALIVGPGIYRNSKLSKYDRQAIVRIDEIKPVRQRAHPRASEIVTYAYDVKFRYIVKGTLYRKSEFIPKNLNNIELLRSIHRKDGQVVFRYESSNPKKGLLSLKGKTDAAK